MIANVARLVPVVAAAALVPATTTVAASGTSGTAVVDLVVSDFAHSMSVYYDNEFVDQRFTTSQTQVEDGEWITLGNWADEEGGWSFLGNCPRGTLIDGWAGDYEGSENHRFQAVAGEHYAFVALCEAYLETTDDSFAVGKLPTDIGPPFGVEYEAELTSSEGWVQSNSRYGTLRDGEPLITTASFEDRGVIGDITTTIDVLDFSIDADGNVVDATVVGSRKTDWSLGGERLVSVTHAAGTLNDGTLVLTLHSYEGGPTLAEYVMRPDSSPWNPGGGGGLEPAPPELETAPR
ncbi:MAG: hypothetical protein AAGA42_11070 [Actinomycetota bacterium]